MNIFICFLVVLLLLFLLILRIMRLNEIEQENRLIQSYMDSVGDFYAAIQNRIDAVRRYRHDLAKHIQTLECVLQDQNSAEIQEYADNLKNRYGALKKEQYCTDEVVNAVLSVKRQQCLERSIPLEFQIEDTDYHCVQEIDMVALLHNLLDNAIEANERIQDKNEQGIRLEMMRTGKEIRIMVENRICDGENVEFKTRKENKEEHGIGTQIIDFLIKKYNGTKQIIQSPEEHLFRKEIHLFG